MLKWLKCIFNGGHKWYVPEEVELSFNQIGIRDHALMRHRCSKCGVDEDNSWAYWV